VLKRISILFLSAGLILGICWIGQARPCYRNGLYVLQIARASSFQVTPGDHVDVTVSYSFSGDRLTTRALQDVEIVKIAEPMIGNTVYLNLNVTPAQADILTSLRNLPDPRITIHHINAADIIDNPVMEFTAQTWVAGPSNDLPL
jgi:hypothetical protein